MCHVIQSFYCSVFDQENFFHVNICVQIFIGNLLAIVRDWKQCTCPVTHEWMKQIVLYMRCYSAKKNTLLINYNPIGKSCIDFFGKKEIICENTLLYIVMDTALRIARRYPLATTVKTFAVTFDWGGKTHSECRQHNPMAWVLDWTKGGKDIMSAFLALYFPTVDTMC